MSLATLSAPKSELVRRTPLPKPSLGGWLVFAGVMLRFVHYLVNHSIWYDEAVLLVNILTKDYAHLLGPLDFEVAAPPLFLWVLRGIAVTFGDHPYLWRLPPFLVSCVQLGLMTMLARRMLKPAPAAFVIALAAFSDGFIWLGCNVKPYILDACLSTSFIYVYVRSENWTALRRILLYALAAPFLLVVSYPMIFMYAVLFVALLPQVWRGRQRQTWVAYLAMAAIVAVVMASLYFGPIRAQRVPGLVAGWWNKFPHSHIFGGLPGWVAGNTFLVFHYCYNPIGAFFVFPVGAGAWWCLRNGRFDWLCLCVGPILVCLAAACFHIYPYSNNRLIIFLAPGIGLMTGLGLSFALTKIRRPATGWATMAVALIGPEMVLCGIHLCMPWPYPDAASGVRFIHEHQQPGDVVAGEPGTLTYFFFGQLHPLAEVSDGDYPAGQRVWVVMDRYVHLNAEDRRKDVLAHLRPVDWEMRSETSFRGTDVYEVLRRPGHGADSRGSVGKSPSLQ